MYQWRYPFAMLGIVFVLIGYAFWPKRSQIPVLIYHDIASSTRPSDSYTVERDLLARELDYLAENGYTPITFATASVLRANNKLPARPIILSFDDALPGQTLALDELKTSGFFATFFIPSNLVGDSAHLSWQDVRRLSESGMEIGGHTANHVRISELTATGLENEILSDKHRIETEIGKPITVFSYPFQEKTDAADTVVARAGYSIVRDSSAFKSSVMINSFDVFLKAL